MRRPGQGLLAVNRLSDYLKPPYDNLVIRQMHFIVSNSNNSIYHGKNVIEILFQNIIFTLFSFRFTFVILYQIFSVGKTTHLAENKRFKSNSIVTFIERHSLD